MRKFLISLGNTIRHFPWGRIFIVGIVFFGSFCFADANSDGINMIIQVMDIIFALISALLTPAVILAGWLLSPDWTMGDFFGLRPYFINVWVLVSNIVYIAFALILLFLAIMQIFGGESSEYTFKAKLPKFLVGILMVPFTWLIVSWTLSFANQATAAVLAIPMGAITSMQDNSNSTNGDKGIFHEKLIPTHISVDLTQGGQNKSDDVDCSTTTVDSNSKKCISAAEFIKNNGSGPYFIMIIYAYDIFKVQMSEFTNLSAACSKDTEASKCIKNLTDVVIKFGTSLIVTFFFGVLTIALCWVLLMRAFKLWIYVMFSPLFGLAYFTGEGWGGALESSGGGGGESSGMTSLGFVPFFRLAMVPVMVSGVLAFGLLFIGVISETFSTTNMTTTSSGSSSNSSKTICTNGSGFLVRFCATPSTNSSSGSSGQGYTSRLIIGSDTTNADKSTNKGSGDYTITFDFGDMFSGFIGNSSTSTVISGVASGTVDSVESVFAHIILTLMSLAVIWVGIKAAVNYDEVTKKAFEPFSKLGDSVQTFVQHIPSYLPTPHPAFKMFSPEGITALADGIRTNVDTHIADDRKTLADLINNPSTRAGIAKVNIAPGDMKQLNDTLKDNRDLSQSPAAFEPLKQSVEMGLAKIADSKTQVDDGGTILTVKKLQTELKSNRNISERNDTLNHYKPLLDAMKKSTNQNEVDTANALSALAKSSSSGSSQSANIFTHIKTQGNEVIFSKHRINTTNGDVKFDTIGLTTDQKRVIINTFKDKINNADVPEGLKKIFPDSELDKLPIDRQKTIATSLLKKAEER